MEAENKSKKAKVEMHSDICIVLNDTFERKNADYGDSFARVREKYPNAILIRLNDKLNRLERLLDGADQQVASERIEDTLLDMANYCIMEVIERTNDKL